MSESYSVSTDQQALIETLIQEIDELLAMRQGFPQAYRQWFETATTRLRDSLGDDFVNEFEQKGPRQIPVNRQHRVHIFRQRLHAQRRFLEELSEQDAE